MSALGEKQTFKLRQHTRPKSLSGAGAKIEITS
jgi:hypothetical protein